MVKPLKIIFMGTPDFATQALQTLLDSDHDVVCVLSQPPRPKGRGHKVIKSPVHELADNYNIPVHTPKRLKQDKDVKVQLRALNADLAVVAAYGQILSQEVLDIPRLGCVNIHASLLPRWRGASPIHHAIWHGDDQTGISIMKMDAGMDTGPVYQTFPLDILPAETTPQLFDRLAPLGGKAIVQVLNQLSENEDWQPEPQDESLVTHAPLLKKEDGAIDWSCPAEEIGQQIRALQPWPGAYTGNIKIKKAVILSKRSASKDHLVPEDGGPTASIRSSQDNKVYGTLLNKNGDVACGAGTILRLIEVQPQGKQAMDVASAINGRYLKIGEVVGG